MKANELRIGNYIKDRGGKTLKIDWIEKDKVCQQMMVGVMEVHPMTEYFDQLRPIPLTKEQIELFDWFSIDEDRYAFRDIEYYQISEEGSLYFSGKYTCTEIKYVHQLQNLYFALTGEELTIIVGFFKSFWILLFNPIKQPAILHGYCNEWFARQYKVKRELYWHRTWNQLGKQQFILKFLPGKLIVCSKLELEVYKKKGLISKSASIRKLTNKSL